MPEHGDVKLWYDEPKVQYNICPYLFRRTTDFIAPKVLAQQINLKRMGYRYRRVFTIKGLKWTIEKYELITKPFNFYASCATVKQDFPTVSPDPIKEREQRKEINANWEQYIDDYDFFMDFDNEDLTIPLSDLKKVKKLYDELNVPYWVMFTANKGFNIVIDGADFKDLLPVKERWLTLLEVAQVLKRKLGLSSLDESVYTAGRVFKTPYTVERRRNLVALPLTDQQIMHFDEDDYEIGRVLQAGGLYQRGLLKRQGSAEGIKKLLEYATSKRTIMDRFRQGIQGFKEGMQG